MTRRRGLVPVTAEALRSLRNLIEQDAHALLFKQNNEAKRRRSTKSTVVGKASYEDIEDARAKRAAKGEVTAGKGKRGRKRKTPTSVEAKAKKARSEADDEIAAGRMEDYCSVFQLQSCSV
jgi:hypothetical protein